VSGVAKLLCAAQVCLAQGGPAALRPADADPDWPDSEEYATELADALRERALQLDDTAYRVLTSRPGYREKRMEENKKARALLRSLRDELPARSSSLASSTWSMAGGSHRYMGHTASSMRQRGRQTRDRFARSSMRRSRSLGDLREWNHGLGSGRSPVWGAGPSGWLHDSADPLHSRGLSRRSSFSDQPAHVPIPRRRQSRGGGEEDGTPEPPPHETPGSATWPVPVAEAVARYGRRSNDTPLAADQSPGLGVATSTPTGQQVVRW